MSSSTGRPAKVRQRPERPPRKVRPLRRSPRQPREREIINLLPAILPITDAEIDLLGRLLGSHIDAILKGSRQATEE